MDAKQQLYSSMCNFTKHLTTQKRAGLLQQVGLAAHARFSLASATPRLSLASTLKQCAA